jgi:hypothetical protein
VPDTSLALASLEKDGLLRRERDRYRTTRKWQSAMIRAAGKLYAAGDPGEDMRVPIATALVDIYGDTLPEDDIVRYIEALLPVEDAELHPPIDAL